MFVGIICHLWSCSRDKNRRTNFENVVDISYVDSTDAENDNYCAICELYYYDKKRT